MEGRSGRDHNSNHNSNNDPQNSSKSSLNDNSAPSSDQPPSPSDHNRRPNDPETIDFKSPTTGQPKDREYLKISYGAFYGTIAAAVALLLAAVILGILLWDKNSELNARSLNRP